MAESAKVHWARVGELSDRLHALLGISEPCRNACTHVVSGRWTALGIANVLVRQEEREDERQ